MHRLAWHNPNRKENEIKESLVLALLDAGETVMLQDEDGQYIFIANLPAVWTRPHSDGVIPTDREIFGEQIAKTLSKAKSDLAVSGNKITIEIGAGDDQIFQFQLFSTTTSDNRHVVKTTIRDVSVDRRREQLLRTLLREVSHRSRNLMAIIQSLSDQTARFSLTIDEFLKKFRGRLYALAQSQDLLTDSDWRGADLHDLLRQQVELYLPEYPRLVKTEGPDIFLNPNAAMYLGLAFHELVVNTVSHRREFLQVENIRVGCTTDNGLVTLSWIEPLPQTKESPQAEKRHRSSFGSVVLEKVVPVALNGTAIYNIEDDKIFYQLTFPVSSLA